MQKDEIASQPLSAEQIAALAAAIEKTFDKFSDDPLRDAFEELSLTGDEVGLLFWAFLNAMAKDHPWTLLNLLSEGVTALPFHDNILSPGKLKNMRDAKLRQSGVETTPEEIDREILEHCVDACRDHAIHLSDDLNYIALWAHYQALPKGMKDKFKKEIEG